ncbi:MAG: GIY-YIG nuclease family protein [Candidatus Latescibacterota bacterium]
MDKSKQAALKREYKENRRPAGVYQIKNTVTGKIFIGSSVDVNARINRHKAGFAFLDSHEMPGLIEDVKKYGAESFTFEALETLEGEYDSDTALREDLKLLEQMWLEKCDPYDGRGYNKR